MSQDRGEKRVEVLKKYLTHNIFYFVFVIKKKKQIKKQRRIIQSLLICVDDRTNKMRKMLHFEFGNFSILLKYSAKGNSNGTGMMVPFSEPDCRTEQLSACHNQCKQQCQGL